MLEPFDVWIAPLLPAMYAHFAAGGTDRDVKQAFWQTFDAAMDLRQDILSGTGNRELKEETETLMERLRQARESARRAEPSCDGSSQRSD